MPTRLIALFNLRPHVDPHAYETWARTIDLPAVNALPSVDSFEVLRVTALLGSPAPPPYAYAEIIDVADMDRFGTDTATPQMRDIAAAFASYAEVTFLRTEPLGA